MGLKLFVIGCGSATPMESRISSAFALKRETDFFLIDCSEGTQMRLKNMGIRMQKISCIFISHLHGDHYFGLVCLLSTFHLFGRKTPVHIYAHKMLKEIIDIQMKAGNTTLCYPLVFHEIKENEHSIIYEDDTMYVETFPLLHSIPTNGFIFKEKTRPNNICKDFVNQYNLSSETIMRIKAGEDYIDTEKNIVFKNADITRPSSYKPKKFAYCSDTAYSEAIVPFIENVDLLYHEATFMSNMKHAAEEKSHATAAQAAQIAKMAKVKRLLIGHYSSRYINIDGLVEEACAIFPETVGAEEGMIIEI